MFGGSSENARRTARDINKLIHEVFRVSKVAGVDKQLVDKAYATVRRIDRAFFNYRASVHTPEDVAVLEAAFIASMDLAFDQIDRVVGYPEETSLDRDTASIKKICAILDGVVKVDTI